VTERGRDEPVFAHAPLSLSIAALEDFFAGSLEETARHRPLRNPHYEPRVTAADRARAVPASVLIPVVPREAGPTIVVTRRHEQISYPGHICFPGGRADATDRDAVHTALREAEEEIDLVGEAVRVIGRLGDYVSHSGFRITPVVAVLAPPLALAPAPGEVEEILEIPLAHVLDSRSYRLERVEADPPRGYFVLEHEGIRVTGPTIGIMMGLYEALLGS
jgi:8-oxo-dGTP pyrophosphatase MutT (NUDIX family)